MHEALAFLSCSTTLCFFGGKMPAWVKNIFTECMDGSSDWWEVWMVSSNAQQRHFDPRHWWALVISGWWSTTDDHCLHGCRISDQWDDVWDDTVRALAEWFANRRAALHWWDWLHLAAQHVDISEFLLQESRVYMFPGRQTLTDWWEKDRHSGCQQMIAAATGERSTRPHFVSSCKKHCLLERCRVGALCLHRCYWRQTILSKILLGIDFVFWIIVQDLILDIWLNPCACVCISVCVFTDQNIAVQALTWSCPIFGIWLIPCEVVAK